MFPVDINLLSRMVYQEHLLDAEQNRHLHQLAKQRPAFWRRAEHWLGERLVRWGTRLMAHYPPTYQAGAEQHPRWV